MKTLYDLGTDELKLMEALEQCPDGEVPPELAAFLDEHAADVGRKLDGYLAVLKTIEMEAVAAKAEEDQWAAKRKARERRAEFLKLRLREHLERTQQQKVTTATGRVIALQANGGKEALELDETWLMACGPDSPFVCHEPKPNKDAMRDFIMAGGTLPFARFLPRGTSLRIK